MDELALGLEYLAFKTTLDRLANDLGIAMSNAISQQVKVAEVEDSTKFEDVMKSAPVAVLYRLRSFVEHPRRPRFSAEFSVALKTRGDENNLVMSNLVNLASAYLGAETRVEVRNYTSFDKPKLGSAFITFSTVSRQEFDREQGLRTIICRAMAVIHAGESTV